MQHVAPFDFREYFEKFGSLCCGKVVDEKIPGYTLVPEGSWL